MADVKFSQRNPLTSIQVNCHNLQVPHERAANTLPDNGAKMGHSLPTLLAGIRLSPFCYGFEANWIKTIQFLRAGNYLNVEYWESKGRMYDGQVETRRREVLFRHRLVEVIRTLCHHNRIRYQRFR